MTGTPDANLERLHRIAAAVTWAQIGARDGKPGKVAKRDAKKQAREMRRAAWRGYVPQDDPSREAVLQEAAITADGWCPAHHCFRTECTYRTHVHTVRLLDADWERVAAKAAAKGMDTNAGVVAALKEWAAGE